MSQLRSHFKSLADIDHPSFGYDIVEDEKKWILDLILLRPGPFLTLM